MSIDGFDYEGFAKKLAEQVPKLLPEDLGIEDEKYIKNTLYNFALLSGEALYNDETTDYEAKTAEYITQIIAEWTFHKSIDLAHSDIPKEYWDPIMQKIAYTIFEVIKGAIKRNISDEQILQLVEKHVNKVWKACINDLKENNVISNDIANTSKDLSNIDDFFSNSGKNNEKVDFLEKIYNSESANKQVLKSFKIKFNIKQKFETIKEKSSEYFESFVTYIKAIIAIAAAVCIATFLFYMLDEVNILSIVAGNKGFMYILSVLLFIGVAVFAWYKFNQKAVKDELKKLQKIRSELEGLSNPDNMYDQLGVEIIKLQFGQGLLSIADVDQEGLLFPKIVALRQKLTEELGYIVPNIRITDNCKLENYEYAILVRENIVSSGYVYPDKYMVSAEEWDKINKHIPETAIVSVNPIYQDQAYWIEKEDIVKRVKTEKPEDVIIGHLKQVLIEHVEDIFTIADVQKLIDFVGKQEPKLYKDIQENGLTEYDLKKIFINLIREKVSIKDVEYVFEKISEYSKFSKDSDILSERLRASFGRQICQSKLDEDYVLYALTLSPEWEKTLDDSCQRTELGTMFLLNPIQVQDLIESTAMTLMKAHQQIGQQPVILCSPRIRLPLFQLLVQHIPTIVVISYSELVTDIKVEDVDMIGEKHI